MMNNAARPTRMSSTINRDGHETMEGFATNRVVAFTVVQLLGEIVS